MDITIDRWFMFQADEEMRIFHNNTYWPQTITGAELCEGIRRTGDMEVIFESGKFTSYQCEVLAKLWNEVGGKIGPVYNVSLDWIGLVPVNSVDPERDFEGFCFLNRDNQLSLSVGRKERKARFTTSAFSGKGDGLTDLQGRILKAMRDQKGRIEWGRDAHGRIELDGREYEVLVCKADSYIDDGSAPF